MKTCSKCGESKGESEFYMAPGTTRLRGKCKKCCISASTSHTRKILRECPRARARMLWNNMRQRCENPNSTTYYAYGARGITVCERWRSFDNFYADMGPRPGGMSLDRIDNGGPYSPENCRWASAKDQCSNTRKNRFVLFNGNKITLSEFSRQAGINRTTVGLWNSSKTLTQKVFDFYGLEVKEIA
jgi:hypothetical protein